MQQNELPKGGGAGMIRLEAGRLGAIGETNHVEEKGYRSTRRAMGTRGTCWWGARGLIVEFGRGKPGHSRPWRVSWGCNDQLTLRA